MQVVLGNLPFQVALVDFRRESCAYAVGRGSASAAGVSAGAAVHYELLGGPLGSSGGLVLAVATSGWLGVAPASST